MTNVTHALSVLDVLSNNIFIDSFLFYALSHAHTGGHYVSQDSRVN